MTEKRFEIFPQNVVKDGTLIIIQKGLELYNVNEVVDLLNELHEENEQLKYVLGNILLEVKREITNTNVTGEVRVFINPNSFELISEVLRKYGALKEWYE